MFEINSHYKIIGKGKQATVVSDDVYAYKVFNENYPLDWIKYEFNVQNEINKTQLPIIKYYSIVDENCIKMDFIKGDTLGALLQKSKLKNGVEVLIDLQKQMHIYHDLNLPHFYHDALNLIDKIEVINEYKKLFKTLLNNIGDSNTLLHLDFHYLNIMFDKQYYIIDWVNAKLGHPIFDFARSYVIMNEYVYRLGCKYKTLILKDKTIDTSYLEEAIYIMSILRLREERSQRTLTLIDDLYQILLKKTQ
jgi:hypothetical protein